MESGFTEFGSSYKLTKPSNDSISIEKNILANFLWPVLNLGQQERMVLYSF